MHIGFITSHFPFHNAKSVGGIGTSIKNLGDELVIAGHKVTVFVYNQEADEKFIEAGIHIQKIKNIRFKGLSWWLTRKKIQHEICKTSKFDKIDIVEAPDWEGITAFIKLPCPIVIRENGSDTYFCYLDKRPVKKWNKFQEKWALRQANAIIAVSSFTGKVTNKIFGIDKPFAVIPNGINIDMFFPEPIAASHKTILYFGGIIRKKGLLEIPHYFNIVNEKFPEVNLILVGADMPDKISGSPSTFKMMELLFSLTAQQKVAFKGSVPYHEIKKYINAATVCIFPSYAEALPVSWLEAMAMEKAIVASDIGWSNEIIDDGKDGFKVNPAHHKDFAERIIRLLEDEPLRHQIEKNARKKISSKFSSKITANQTIECYKEIIKNARFKRI
ncbi:MAG: glycosyltransferase family 4 protein [Flavobacterium sp.]|nr:glycosyltransferase family 4 protein [Flavobacterium sp.]